MKAPPHHFTMDRSKEYPKEELTYLRIYGTELSSIHRYLMWMKFFSWCKHLPMLIKTAAVHTFITALHLTLYQTETTFLARLIIWASSFVIVMSTIYLVAHHSRRRRRMHWVGSGARTHLHTVNHH